MKVTLKTTDDTLNHYVGTNEKGHEMHLSGDSTAVGPMESLLIAAAGCSTIDIVMILKKMRQNITNIEVEVDGTRREEIPRVYTDIHLHYKIYGEVKETKAAQAMEMSLEKYCSVSLMLEKAAKITGSFEVIK